MKKLSQNGLSVAHWFKRVWKWLVEPAWIGSARERDLSRVLNIILLLLITWGTLFEIQSSLDGNPFNAGDKFALGMIAVLVLAYFLNRQGQFSTALLLTLGFFITSIFVAALRQHFQHGNNLLILYYLIIAILMGDLFFSLRGYVITSSMILAGVLGISLLNPAAITIFLFLFVFCALIGFSSQTRRFIQEQQLALTKHSSHERILLAIEQRRSAQLSLLEEVGRQITESLDEKEILERTLEAVVNKFGYAQTAISLLVKDDLLEIAAISGTEDFGYPPGFQQKVGHGIAGHVALTHKAHMAVDVSVDPYYFSSAERSGSAVGIPMLDKDQLLGVIYVESAARNAIRSDDVQTLQTLANQVATALQKARLYARTQQHLRLMTILQSISRAVTSSLELDEILKNVIRLLKDSLGYTYLGVYLLDGEVLHLGAQLGYPYDQLIREIPLTLGVIGRTARTKETQFIRDVSADPDFIRASYEVRSEIAIPLLKDENVLGVLNVESKDATALDENDVNFLNALAGSIAVAIDNARLHAEVKQMALTDVVSGLANRRAFDELLEAEIARASRYGQSLSLIILDLDSFKAYNDKWGHPAGDVRLREISDLLRANVREPDVAARYGGEEFAIILPNTVKIGALRLAERLRQAAEANSPYKNGVNSPISGYTISLGVATFPDDAGSVEELLHAADKAELTAKRLGKNRVHAANLSDKIQNS
ncbi:MAG TPA: diguanylate cyclase [Anaerolineales bacterium]|nr:diguanylate cyclase [Anaerolineales bacterium]